MPGHVEMLCSQQGSSTQAPHRHDTGRQVAATQCSESRRLAGFDHCCSTGKPMVAAKRMRCFEGVRAKSQISAALHAIWNSETRRVWGTNPSSFPDSPWLSRGTWTFRQPPMHEAHRQHKKQFVATLLGGEGGGQCSVPVWQPQHSP